MHHLLSVDDVIVDPKRFGCQPKRFGFVIGVGIYRKEG